MSAESFLLKIQLQQEKFYIRYNFLGIITLS